MSVFETLNKIDVNEWTDKKGTLTYLSWAHAYKAVKMHYPLMTYKTYENDLGFNYHTDGNTCWVKVSTTIEELEYIEYLPVMNFKNKSIPKDVVTSMDVNSAIQRALTKSLARHGLGLYIYAGEDINSSVEVEKINEKQLKLINTLMSNKKVDRDTIKKHYGVTTLKDLPLSVVQAFIEYLEKL